MTRKYKLFRFISVYAGLFFIISACLSGLGFFNESIARPFAITSLVFAIAGVIFDYLDRRGEDYEH